MESAPCRLKNSPQECGAVVCFAEGFRYCYSQPPSLDTIMPTMDYDEQGEVTVEPHRDLGNDTYRR
jgi:hypothetical protein